MYNVSLVAPAVVFTSVVFGIASGLVALLYTRVRGHPLIPLVSVFWPTFVVAGIITFVVCIVVVVLIFGSN
jgi:hypothetical protein